MKKSSMLSLAVLIAIAALGCDRENKSSAPADKSNTPPQAKSATTAAATKPIIPQVQLADWCPEHGVPESVCTRCNESLVAGFKAKGDWCEKHNLPKSQDTTCFPEVAAKWKAMEPKKK